MLTEEQLAALDEALALLSFCRCLDVAGHNLVTHLSEARRVTHSRVYAYPAQLAAITNLASRCRRECGRGRAARSGHAGG